MANELKKLKRKRDNIYRSMIFKAVVSSEGSYWFQKSDAIDYFN